MAKLPEQQRVVRTPQWWIRVCHWLWEQQGLVWGTVLLGIVLNLFATWLVTPFGSTFSNTPLGTVFGHPWISLLGGMGLLALTGLIGSVSRLQDASTLHVEPTISPTQQIRDVLVNNLGKEYSRQLLQSLQGAKIIGLELHERSDVTRSPTQLVFRWTTATYEHPLPPGTSIAQVYDDAGSGLLILGEPGAGKTTLLLDLARELIIRAKSESAYPIPVILNLSSWATKKAPMAVWIIDQLQLVYQVPRSLGEAWVQSNQILPLLDGLDEVTAPARTACIEAINTYREDHFVPLVVCCRSREFLEQEKPLALPQAIVVQPITKEQVNDYLKQVGKPMAGVRTVLRTNAILYDLITTPLMLTILILTYRGKTGRDLLSLDTAEKQRQRIFDSYVERMLEPRVNQRGYDSGHILGWLRWLALQMKQQSQTTFYLEHIQPNWLSERSQRRAYERYAVRLPDVLIGILISLVIASLLWGYRDVVDLLQYAWIGGLIGGLISRAEQTDLIVQVQEFRWSRLGRNLLSALVAGLLVGLGVGLSYGLRVGPMYGWKNWLRDGIGFGGSLGLGSFLLLMVLRRELFNRPGTGKPIGGRITYPWKRFDLPLFIPKHIRYGVCVGIFLGTSYGLMQGVSYGLSVGLSFALDVGLSYGLCGVLISTLFAGRTGTIQPAEILNWSWSSLRLSLVRREHLKKGMLFVLSVGPITGLSAGVGTRLLGLGVSTGISYGLSIGLAYWLIVGSFQSMSSSFFNEQQRVIPNLGIYRSAQNGLLFGVFSGVIGGGVCILSKGLSYGFSDVLSDGLSEKLSVGLSTGLHEAFIIIISSGLLAFLLTGGLAWWRHYILRFLLWRRQSIPWNYPRFLDEATDRILLRKSGGGYGFIHPLFLEYFATSDTTIQNSSAVSQRPPLVP